MNLLILALVGVAAAGLLGSMGIGRRLRSFAGAALMLGAIGFAVQAARHLPGKPVTAGVTPVLVDPGMVAFREAVFAPDRADSLALASADARLQAGDAHAAADGLRREIALRPNDAVLWSGFGAMLAQHDGAVSPAAKFAFRRALALAPRAPGPAFFLGMAYADAGDFGAARLAWRHALAMTPADAAYRPDIVERLAAIDQFEAMQARRG
ncbi:tetratricopeptide repeat protein [Sphingomonas sp. PAMC 26605]|uniref:tetratricopeptide repeat protein n=1 Tax=Sphingomonas sp. PAMC 26605 TaxID=1112214 RepID=UPI0002D726EC|nr:cytochrome c biosynthesis protein [Sphingomonas sp. PAMC 26605]